MHREQQVQRPWGMLKEWSEPEKAGGGKVREGTIGGILGAAWATLRPWGLIPKDERHGYWEV